MSAIWGCVDLSDKALPDGLCAVMEKPLHEYKVDRYDSISEKNVTFGCGLQYIKRWSENEQLPLYDSDTDTYFTADCLIDNRAELINELCHGKADIPDGALMYLAYKKWGEDMVKRIYGSYSYAIYDAKKNQLIIGADHTFNSTIYYQRAGSTVFFGTLIESVIQGAGGKPSLNEEWLAFFLSMRTLGILANPVDTPYLGVSRVVASHYCVFSGDGMTETEYWSPKKNAMRLNYKKDDEYKEHFRALFGKCVRETIDGLADEPSILLSSGFDSSSVAAFAARELDLEGKKLHGYTHVPVPGHVSIYRKSILNTNETDGVLSFCKMYPNVVPNFCPLPQCNGFSNLREILKAYETPYKSLINVDWICSLMELASAGGSRLMLTGQMGNSTISFGDITIYERHLITRGRLLRALSTISRYSRLVNRSRKRHFIYIASSFLPVWLRGIPKDTDYLEGTYVSSELAKRMGITSLDKRLKNTNDRRMGSHIHSFRECQALFFNPIAFAHISDGFTKQALRSGIVVRDPTRDIRIFEFCLGAPIECFVNSKPSTRRMARSYLSDMLPAEILPESAPRGRQTGDWHERVSPNLDSILSEMELAFNAPGVSRIIDTDAALRAVRKYREKLDKIDDVEFIRLGAAYNAAIFVLSRGWA